MAMLSAAVIVQMDFPGKSLISLWRDTSCQLPVCIHHSLPYPITLIKKKYMVKDNVPANDKHKK